MRFLANQTGCSSSPPPMPIVRWLGTNSSKNRIKFPPTWLCQCASAGISFRAEVGLTSALIVWFQGQEIGTGGLRHSPRAQFIARLSATMRPPDRPLGHLHLRSAWRKRTGGEFLTKARSLSQLRWRQIGRLLPGRPVRASRSTDRTVRTDRTLSNDPNRNCRWPNDDDDDVVVVVFGRH